MKKNDYISVSKFAKMVNVSNQAIYQRLDKDLTKYVKVINNKKMVNIKALELFNIKEVVQAIDKELIKTLQSTISLLQEQLQVKDEQISMLMKMNESNQILIAREQEQPKQLVEDVKSMNETKKRKWWKFDKQ